MKVRTVGSNAIGEIAQMLMKMIAKVVRIQILNQINEEITWQKH